MGGGLGVTYDEEKPPLPAELMAAVRSRFEGKEMMLIVEPGRSIAANAGLFITSVEYLKHTQHKNFAIVDGAMNDLLRPALYGAWQEIILVSSAKRLQRSMTWSGRYANQRIFSAKTGVSVWKQATSWQSGLREPTDLSELKLQQRGPARQR